MASTGEVWKLGHRPALDGVRGIAVLLVVLAHAFPPWFLAAGAVGVAVFFTLSGFLITGLLLEEHAATGRIRVGEFYRRRAFRLLPALAVFLGAMLVCGLAWPYFGTPGSVAAVALYFGNWLPATGHQLGGLNHTWSLAVEEQFYVAFPLLLVLLVGHISRRALVAVLAFAAALSLLLRGSLILGGASVDRIYYGTDTTVGLLLMGAVGAAAMPLWGPRRAYPQVALVAVAAVVALGVVGAGLGVRSVVPMVGSTLALVIVVAVSGGPCRRFTSRPLVLLGKRSYALYLWHFPLTMGVAPVAAVAFGLPDFFTGACAAGVSWWFACLSWRFVEQPSLAFRDRRAPIPPASVYVGAVV